MNLIMFFIKAPNDNPDKSLMNTIKNVFRLQNYNLF